MFKQTDKILAEGITRRGILSSQDLDRLIAQIQTSEKSLKDCLVEKGIVTEIQVLEILSDGLGLQTVNLKNLQIPAAVIERVPVKFAWYYKFMPLKIENRRLVLACSRPLDVKIEDEIRVHLGLEPQIVLCKESEVIEAINKHYGLAADTIEKILSKDTGKKANDSYNAAWVEDLEKETEDASVSKLVNQILFDAYQKRATDIHFEPYRNKVRVRYRIDGVLVDSNLPVEVKHFLPAILSRLKIMANLSIVEKRIPQDGSTVVKTKEQDLDLRISTIPTPRGESMVIRILPTKVMLYSMDKLGLDPANLLLIRKMLQKPHGIILATGPTGSGKTTTLYACLNEINSSERKIITIEDPVEYEMEGVTQIQVNPKVNLTFATGLRSILRHDPDIIMVGEIRDTETAEIAIRTALTGHLVFSTLHTNDASSGITRLIDMGIEPYLVASSVEVFIAQRLVRNICPACKKEVKDVPFEVKEEIALALRLTDPKKVKVYAGSGCDYCQKTGYWGRTAIYEILVMNDEIKSAILEKPRADYIKKIAVKNGMITLRQDGWKKVIEGVTTPLEVVHATEKEESETVASDFSSLGIKKFSSPQDPTKDFYRLLSKDLLSGPNEYEERTYSRALAKVERDRS